MPGHQDKSVVTAVQSLLKFGALSSVLIYDPGNYVVSNSAVEMLLEMLSDKRSVSCTVNALSTKTKIWVQYHQGKCQYNLVRKCYSNSRTLVVQ